MCYEIYKMCEIKKKREVQGLIGNAFRNLKLIT